MRCNKQMNKNIIKSVIDLMISNILLLSISVLSSFITPVILGHEGYGYYRIFTLYISYVPLLHLGFIDGVLIRNAGRKYNSMSLKKFRTYSKFIISLELIISLIIVLVSFFINLNFIEREIYIAIAVYSFLFNSVTYFQFFSKCILKFKQLALVTRMQSFINLFFLILAFILFKLYIAKVDVSYYLFYMNVTLLIILIYYLVIYKKIVFGKSKSIIKEKNNILVFFKIGFSLMISYQITLLLINADNQFISVFFNISQYANYAFAYSLGSILVSVFGAMASVMLPYMKKAGKKTVLKRYENNLSIIIFVVFLMLIGYYPILWIVNSFLHEYISSIKYLSIVFPGVAITCVIQSYIFNNFILLNKMKQFSLLSFINLVFDYFVYYMTYLITKNTFAIALISIPLLLIWYFSLEFYFNKLVKTLFYNNFIYICILSISFITINHFVDMVYGIIMYVFDLLIVTFIMKYKTICMYIKKIRKGI